VFSFYVFGSCVFFRLFMEDVVQFPVEVGVVLFHLVV